MCDRAFIFAFSAQFPPFGERNARTAQFRKERRLTHALSHSVLDPKCISNTSFDEQAAGSAAFDDLDPALIDRFRTERGE